MRNEEIEKLVKSLEKLNRMRDVLDRIWNLSHPYWVSQDFPAIVREKLLDVYNDVEKAYKEEIHRHNLLVEELRS